MTDHASLLVQAIARRAFELHESTGSCHGRDRDDWYQAERELAVLDAEILVETEGLALMVQIPIEAENGTLVLASISPWSIQVVGVPDASTADGYDQHDLRDLVRYISLPREVIPEEVTTSLDEHGLMLRLPIMFERSILLDGAVTGPATPPTRLQPIVRTPAEMLDHALSKESPGWSRDQ
jgi:hypothetical protein